MQDNTQVLKLSLYGEKIIFFLQPRCQPPVSVIVPQSVTHNLFIAAPLKASVATSLMPLVVSRLSGGRGARATNIKLMLQQSVSVLKRRFFRFFVLLVQRSEPFTLQCFDLKGSRRRAEPQRQECVFFAAARFHRREASSYSWKHSCAERATCSRAAEVEIIGMFPAQILRHLHVLCFQPF